MSDRSSDTFLATIVECNDTAVAQRQLDFSLALLAGYFTRNRTVHLISQPVFTSHGFQLQHPGQIFVKFGCFIFRHCVVTFYGLVYHVSFGRRTEHLVYGQVERTDTVGLLESKTMISGRFTYHVHRSAFTFGNLAYVFDGFFFNKESHAFLAFVCYNFFGRQSFVTDRQLTHVNKSAALFHQFGEAVYVSGRTVVMDRYYRVFVFFAKGTNHIVGAFLHFRVGALYGIQFDTAAVTACIYRRNRTAAQSDTVIVTADHYYFVSGFRLSFQAVALCAVTYASGKHDYFVVTISFIVFRMFKSQYRTADQWLAELVAKITRSVGSFDQDLFRSLV